MSRISISSASTASPISSHQSFSLFAGLCKLSFPASTKRSKLSILFFTSLSQSFTRRPKLKSGVQAVSGFFIEASIVSRLFWRSSFRSSVIVLAKRCRFSVCFLSPDGFHDFSIQVRMFANSFFELLCTASGNSWSEHVCRAHSSSGSFLFNEHGLATTQRSG